MNAHCAIVRMWQQHAQFPMRICSTEYRGGGIYVQKISYCKECNMIYTSNPIDDEILDHYYRHMSQYEAEEEIGFSDNDQWKMFERQFCFINNHVKDYTSVLEIGAATGENLSLYKKIGKRVLGIEPSENNKRWAKEKLGIEMEASTFNEWYEICGEVCFDLIFMSHVLEHIVDFKELVKKIEKLKPKYFFIEVPFAENKGRKEEPFGMFTPEHVNYFSIDSLSRLMEDNGYGLVSLEKPENEHNVKPGYPTLMMLWGKEWEKKGASPTFNPQELLAQYIHESEMNFQYIRDIIDDIARDSKLAVWGTGTHTAKLLGMTSLSQKNIIKFYDSDLKKKGLTMIGKPIDRFCVDDIKNGLIDLILISSHASERSIERSIIESGAKVRVIKLYS